MMDFLIQKAYAAGITSPTPVGSNSTFNSLYTSILNNIVSPVIYLLGALAIVYFVWGVFVFIQNADSPEKRAEGFKHMMWGVIGLFIMVSAKGIIAIIKATIGV